MKLAEIISENNRKGLQYKNQELIRLRMKELAYEYPDQVSIVLNKTGVHFSSKLPPSVLYAIMLKHASKNEKLREAISKMLLEMDGYLGADGQWAGIIGSALTAVGSVVSGIGQGQFQNGDQQVALRQMEIEREQQRQADQDRRRRNGWLIFGVSVVVISGLVIFIKMRQKKQKVAKQLIPSV